MYKFNIILTEMCNANCSHCYMNLNSNKHKKTMSFQDIDKIVEKMPINTISVTLTGGEIFLVKELLFYTIKKIKKKNKDIKIELESNGIYFYKNKNSKELFVELKKMGVDSIRFSDDLFHKDGGVDLEKVRNLKQYESYNTPIIKFLVQDKVVNIGKAKKLDDKYIEKRNCMNTNKTINTPYLFLDVNGDVYICTWKCIPPLGNLITDSFDSIEKKLGDDFFKLILSGNILDAINLVNKKEEYNKKIIDDCGECSLCDRTFCLGGNNDD